MTADVALILCVVGLVVLGQTLLKIGMDAVGVVDLRRLREGVSLVGRVLRTPAVLAGLALYVVSALGWIVVLSRDNRSFAFPLMALSYLAVPLVAVVFLREPLRRSQAAGLALIVVGVAFVIATHGAG